MKNESILVVDNDDTICWVLNTALTDEGYRVDTASNGRKALDKLSAHRYHLVIMDIMMPVMDGLETLKHIRARKNPPEVIMITAHSSMENTIEAMKMGAFDYVVKPFDIDEILSLAARAIKTYHERRETTGPGGMERDTRIIGSSPIMRDLYKILGRIATTDSAVLLTGETGTGKDLFARAIHFHSSRHDKPFITVNCASIPAELLESELFGHVKGAFTGATDNRVGKCELADGGTLFLDEIGTMRLDIQAKILRFLQHSEFERVGGSKTQRVDVRVIAATNADLGSLTELGRFREDLYYRLMVVPITTPPLRDRKEDIPELAGYFIDRFNAKYSLSFTPTDELLTSLAAREWPGNVRELENTIHRMVVLQADARDVGGEILKSFPGRGGSQDLDAVVVQLIEAGQGNLLDAARERIEKPLVERLMARVGNNQSEAARLLGVSRNTLRNMLAKYGIA